MAILFAANFAAANYRMYGFSNSAGHPSLGTYWDLFARSGVGPTGQDAAEIRHNGTVTPTESYYGWSKIPLTAPAQGTAVYIRMLIRINSPIIWQAADGFIWACKLCILGDTASSLSRVIWNMTAHAGSPNRFRFAIDRNIEGFPSAFDSPELTSLVDTWIWAQLKCQSGSAPGVSDGRFSLYINDDNASESTPTAQNPAPMILNTDGWQDLRLGYYGDTMAPGGNITYQFAAFEYGDTFDPNWRDLGTPPPSVTMKYHRLRGR